MGVVVFSALLARRKGKEETSPFYLIPIFSTYSLSSRKAMKKNSNLFPPSKQRLHKSQFLQTLGCQKPYWDQARLSSLVNKPVAMYRPLVHVVTLGNSFGALKKHMEAIH